MTKPTDRNHVGSVAAAMLTQGAWLTPQQLTMLTGLGLEDVLDALRLLPTHTYRNYVVERRRRPTPGLASFSPHEYKLTQRKDTA